MGNIENFRLGAQEDYWLWLNRRAILRSGRVQIFRAGEGKSKYQLDSNLVGKPLSPEKLEEIFGKGVRHYIQTFANNLYFENNWRKFAVSQAKFRFERDPNMMFFQVGKLQEREKGVEVIYLGTGKTDKIPKIDNQIAADSWGFAVLNLREDA